MNTVLFFLKTIAKRVEQYTTVEIKCKTENNNKNGGRRRVRFIFFIASCKYH